MRPLARRGAVLVVLAALLLAAGAARAAAHPLGNLTVNTYSGLRVGPDRLAVDYVVDMAEIPTFQTRQAIDTDHDGRLDGSEATRWRDQECPRLAAGLRATLDGRPVPLAVTASALHLPRGVGGLETLRLECALAAPLPAGRASTRALAYADTNLQGRVGWREITAVGDRTTLEAASVPTTSTSARLTTYPSDQLTSPLDQRTATLQLHPGGPPAPAGWGGPLAPPTGSWAPQTPMARGGVDRATAAFTALMSERSRTPGFAAAAVLLAVALGAAHALAPGHGKTVVAAYLVGLRGTLGQAMTIGVTVTITHTAGVLLLGLVLSTTRAVASERVYPWLGLASGLLLAAVGVGLLARGRAGHPHDPGHEHPHGRGHDHPHGHGHHRPDGHGHHRAGGPPLGRRGLVALGLAGGLVPSPSAVVVLVGGIALGRAWFGVALVLAYGLGMAATLTGVGLLLARLRSRMDRRLQLPPGPCRPAGAGGSRRSPRRSSCWSGWASPSRGRPGSDPAAAYPRRACTRAPAAGRDGPAAVDARPSDAVNLALAAAGARRPGGAGHRGGVGRRLTAGPQDRTRRSWPTRSPTMWPSRTTSTPARDSRPVRSRAGSGSWASEVQ